MINLFVIYLFNEFLFSNILYLLTIILRKTNKRINCIICKHLKDKCINYKKVIITNYFVISLKRIENI